LRPAAPWANGMSRSCSGTSCRIVWRREFSRARHPTPDTDLGMGSQGEHRLDPRQPLVGSWPWGGHFHHRPGFQPLRRRSAGCPRSAVEIGSSQGHERVVRGRSHPCPLIPGEGEKVEHTRDRRLASGGRRISASKAAWRRPSRLCRAASSWGRGDVGRSMWGWAGRSGIYADPCRRPSSPVASDCRISVSAWRKKSSSRRWPCAPRTPCRALAKLHVLVGRRRGSA